MHQILKCKILKLGFVSRYNLWAITRWRIAGSDWVVSSPLGAGIPRLIWYQAKVGPYRTVSSPLGVRIHAEIKGLAISAVTHADRNVSSPVIRATELERKNIKVKRKEPQGWNKRIITREGCIFEMKKNIWFMCIFIKYYTLLYSLRCPSSLWDLTMRVGAMCRVSILWSASLT